MCVPGPPGVGPGFLWALLPAGPSLSEMPACVPHHTQLSPGFSGCGSHAEPSGASEGRPLAD